MRAVGIAILIFIVIAAGALLAYTVDNERLSFFWNNPKTGATDEDITILILGRVAEGQGGRWHAAPELTDAIVIMQYRPSSKTANLISLPRDLYGEFGGESFKINEVYRRGKIDAVMGKLAEITGVGVDKYLVVDAGLIEQAVDELGGIDVELASPVTDPVSGFRLETGRHHLNGEDALWLMRNRYAPGGDFFRERNQHVVIEAIFDRISSLSALERSTFLLEMVPHVDGAEANFSIGELAPRLAFVDDVSFNSIVLDFSTGLLASSYVAGGRLVPASPLATSTDTGTSTIRPPQPVAAYVLLPTKGMNDYSAIRDFIAERLR